LIVSAVSGAAMAILYLFKIAAAERIDSSTLREDARCCLYCLKLSIVVILGSVVALYQSRISEVCTIDFCNFRWLDSALAIGLALSIGYDGIKSIRVSYRADFDGGCGCCAGAPAKEKAKVQSHMPTVGEQEHVTIDVAGIDVRPLLSKSCCTSSPSSEDSPPAKSACTSKKTAEPEPEASAKLCCTSKKSYGAASE
jgi:hypothetical protein